MIKCLTEFFYNELIEEYEKNKINKVKINIKKLHQHAMIPEYATKGSAGFDLACVENFRIETGETIIVNTGLAFEIPEGYELQIRPRSGLSAKTGLRVANSPGTIDSDFRGEVGIILYNTGIPYVVGPGQKIAQGVICPIVQAEFEVVEELSDTERGEGGWGSTGV